jgi:hypothetical protein
MAHRWVGRSRSYQDTEFRIDCKSRQRDMVRPAAGSAIYVPAAALAGVTDFSLILERNHLLLLGVVLFLPHFESYLPYAQLHLDWIDRHRDRRRGRQRRE